MPSLFFNKARAMELNSVNRALTKTRSWMIEQV